MKTATALAAHQAPQPLAGEPEVCPGQVPLPIGGLPPLTRLTPQPQPDVSLRRRSAQFAQVIAEVLSGLRPARQVSSWLSPQVYEQLQRRLRRGTLHHPAKVASIHVDLITDEAAEVVVRLQSSVRSRAMAMRLEKTRDVRGMGRWHCTALSWA